MLTAYGKPLTVCVVPFVPSLIESGPCVPMTVTVSTRRSEVLDWLLTVLVAVVLRSPTVTKSVPENGATSTVSNPVVAAEPLKP